MVVQILSVEQRATGVLVVSVQRLEVVIVLQVSVVIVTWIVSGMVVTDVDKEVVVYGTMLDVVYVDGTEVVRTVGKEMMVLVT